MDSPDNFNLPDKLKDLKVEVGAQFDAATKGKINQILEHSSLQIESN